MFSVIGTHTISMNINCRFVHDFAQCLLSGKGWKGVGLWFLLLLLLLCLLLMFRAFNNIQLSVVIAESPTPSIRNSKLWVNFKFPVSLVSTKELEQKKHKPKCSKVTFHSKKHQSNPPKSYSFHTQKKRHQHFSNCQTLLGGGFKYFLFSHRFGKDSHFDQMGWNHQPVFNFQKDKKSSRMALLGEAGSYAVGGALCIRQRQVGRVVMGLNLTPRKNRHLFKVINGIEREKTFKIKHVVCFFWKKNIPAWSPSLAWVWL